MKFVIHPATERGNAQHGWLESYHSFSFSTYYDPNKMGFGALRVLNDDRILGGTGFGMHPHSNMEIISIPLEGGLTHQDSMGNRAVIKKGEIQVMSAGTGVQHSEYNAHATDVCAFLQIWVIPNQQNVTPRYDQIQLESNAQNQLHQILSPSPDDEGVWIHQNAWFHLGTFDAEQSIEYALKDVQNGVYAFVLEGGITFENHLLGNRDAVGIWETDVIRLITTAPTHLLLMEVPL